LSCLIDFSTSESGVAASLCHRSPKSFRHQLAPLFHCRLKLFFQLPPNC
jgi:hypothetical protein